MPDDLYRTLNVTPSASAEEIQRAYRSLARRHHPDLNPTPSSAILMATINAAYEVLKEPKKRAAYDVRSQKKEPSPVDSAVLSGARENLLRQGWTIVEERSNEYVLKNGSRQVHVIFTKRLDQTSVRQRSIRTTAFSVILAVHVEPDLKIPANTAVIDLMHSKLYGGKFPDSTYQELFKKFF